MLRAERSTPEGKEQRVSLEKWNKTPKRDQETSFNPGGNKLAYNVQNCCFCDKKKYSPW